MKFKFIQVHDPEYHKELMLRWEVLQKPLGLPPGSEQFPKESESLHLLAMDGKKVVGCILFHPESEKTGRVSQLAVSDEYQGKRFGRQIIHVLEKMLSKKGIEEIYLHVLEEATSFYRQLGYEEHGSPYENMGVYHREMKKRLSY